MKAEERAKKLLEHLFDDFDGWPDWWEEDIAVAIAAAEDAAYERGKAEYIESVSNCILIDKERYAELRRRRISGFDQDAPLPSDRDPEPLTLKSTPGKEG